MPLGVRGFTLEFEIKTQKVNNFYEKIKLCVLCKAAVFLRREVLSHNPFCLFCAI